MPRRIIIDTDPGQDDAVAILTALASPEFDVLGITPVAGNVPLDKTVLNARKICEVAGRPDVTIAPGCPRPMVRDLVTAEYVHGKTGLDGYDLPDPTMPVSDRHAVDFIIEAALSSGHKGLTLCTLAPLTNIAMAMVKAPQIVPCIREIVMMGGGHFEGGNVTGTAEFNIYVDPHAAHVVIGSGLPIVMAPLDVTHKATIKRGWLDRVGAVGTPACLATEGWLSFYERYDIERYGDTGGPLHDPCVIAYLLEPELFKAKRVHVAVEIASELTMGATAMDWWRRSGKAPNVSVLHDIDRDGFFDLLLERIARL